MLSFFHFQNLEKRWAVLEGDKMYFYQNKVGNRELSTQKVSLHIVQKSSFTKVVFQ